MINNKKEKWFPIACFVFSMACGGEAIEPVSLVDPLLWVSSDERRDPFIDQRSDDATCRTFGYGTESLEGRLSFFVETALCNYVTVEQPSLEAVTAGNVLSIEVDHFDLSAPEPAESILAIALQERVIWERRISIPSPESSVKDDVVLQSDIKEGDRLQFHLRNHGENSYNLINISVVDPM